MEPIRDATRTPQTPEFAPSNPVIVSGVRTAKASPMMTRMERNCGRMFSKAFQAFFSAMRVFFRSLMKDAVRPAAASAYSK